jgi:prepilin signal peptidase PulO-like enzyme (type II secretory pathway)
MSDIATPVPSWIVALVCFVLGLAIGSFLNVVIYRIPRGESVVTPGSRCPDCGTQIRAWDNVPILSFFLLRGRCRNCDSVISPLYPFVEITTAVLFLVIGLFGGLTWDVAGELWFAATMLTLVCIDGTHQVIPDEITFPSFPISLAGAAFARGTFSFELATDPFITPEELGFSPIRAALFGAALFAFAVPFFWLIDQVDEVLFSKYLHAGEQSEPNDNDARYGKLLLISGVIGALLAGIWMLLTLYRAREDPYAFLDGYHSLQKSLIGIAIGGGVLWLVRAAYFYIRGIEGLGLGDIKLMCVIGAYLGWQGAIGVLVVGSLTGLLFGIYLAIRHRTGLRTRLPFAVFLGTAALIVQLALLIERPAG